MSEHGGPQQGGVRQQDLQLEVEDSDWSWGEVGLTSDGNRESKASLVGANTEMEGEIYLD